MQRTKDHHWGYWQRSCALVLAGAAVHGASAATPSLTPVSVFTTSDATPFLSSTQSVQIAAEGITVLQFAFGFATDESVSPSVFLDSFTFTLASLNSPLAAILATADASGVNWAPATPGNLPLSPDALTFEPIAFYPDLGKTYAQQFAFSVQLHVPNEFNGQDVAFYSDLFSNQNGIQTVGWMGPITAVPEPSTWALIGLGLGGLFLRRRARNS